MTVRVIHSKAIHSSGTQSRNQEKASLPQDCAGITDGAAPMPKDGISLKSLVEAKKLVAGLAPLTRRRRP